MKNKEHVLPLVMEHNLFIQISIGEQLENIIWKSKQWNAFYSVIIHEIY